MSNYQFVSPIKQIYIQGKQMRQRSITQIRNSNNNLFRTQRNQPPNNKISIQKEFQQSQQRQFLFHTQISYRNLSTTPLIKPFNIQKVRQQIKKTFAQLNQVVTNIQQQIERRITLHQQNLVNMIKLQVERMQEDVRKIVLQYNQMLRTKNVDQQLFKANLQLKNYRNQFQKLSLENRQLRKEIKQLKRVDTEKSIDLSASHKNATKLMKKIFKFKMFADLKRQNENSENSNIKEILFTEGKQQVKSQYLKQKTKRKCLHSQRKQALSSLNIVTQQSSLKKKVTIRNQTPITHYSIINSNFKKFQKPLSHRYHSKLNIYI